MAALSNIIGRRFYASFRMPARQSKYEPIEFDRWTFARSKRLVQMDERDRILSQQYTAVMQSPAVVFLHENNCSVDEITRLRRDLAKRQVRLSKVNSRIFRGLLLETGAFYEQFIPLLNGPTMVCWPTDQYRAVDDLQSPKMMERIPLQLRPPAEFDSVSFTRDILSVISGPVTPASVRKKLIVLGAKMQQSVLGPAELKSYSQMPTRSQLLGQLLGTLQQPQISLIASMEHHSNSLVRLLDYHAKSDTNSDK